MLHKSEAVNNICRNSCAILDVTLQFADIGLYNNFDINNGAERTRARHVQVIRAFATCGRYTRYVITLRRSINILDRWDKRGGEIFRRNRRDSTAAANFLKVITRKKTQLKTDSANPQS